MLTTAPSDRRGLVAFLHLEEAGPDRFRGWCHAGLPLRAFGGQVAAQALTAAGHTVAEGWSVHSLHGYFLRGGQTTRPITYEVDRLREGGSYCARQVSAVQDGEVIFTLSASFKTAEEGVYDRQVQAPTAPHPDSLPDLFGQWAEVVPADYGRRDYRAALEVRRVPTRPTEVTAGQTEQKLWIRSATPLADDPLLHACSLAYASDLLLAPTAALSLEQPRPLRGGPSKVYMTSLDHALWFHRPFRADEWMLFTQRSPSSSDGRALAFADVWSQDGQLIASVVQEAVMRPLRESRGH